MKYKTMKVVPETHQQGYLSIENQEMIDKVDFTDCDFGLQTNWDGRVWICINGIAWLRFKPKTQLPDSIE